MKTIITTNAKETKKLGKLLAQELLRFNLDKTKDGTLDPLIICLSGDLGSGKTTFVQGLLKGLKIKGPHTSPTFLVIKHYKKKFSNSKSQISSKSKKSKMLNIYHIDAYRIKSKDLLNLGWKEIISHKNNIVIIEWADRIKKIIPRQASWIKFGWKNKKERYVLFDKLRLHTLNLNSKRIL